MIRKKELLERIKDLEIQFEWLYDKYEELEKKVKKVKK